MPCKFPDHQVICRRHQLWIGPSVRHPSGQYDLAPFPELLRAQRHHERIVRRHGPAAAPAAHRHADRIWRNRLSHRTRWTPTQLRLLTALVPDAPRPDLELEHWSRRHECLQSTAATIAIYPDVVRLTDLLLDLRGHPQWDWIWNRRR